jgi:hypothetical protein
MSQSIVSEPTLREVARAAESFPQTFEAFERQMEADAPRPREEAPAPNGEEPVWRLPRTGAGAPYGLHPHAIETGIAYREDFLSVRLMAETVPPARHLVGARTAELAAAASTDAHARLLDSDEYRRASTILPEHASAARALAAASAKLQAIEQKRAKAVANPAKGIGKALAEIDAQAAAARAEVAGHQAEADALAPAAASAREALTKAAVTHAIAARNASYETRNARLVEALNALVAKFGEDLLEVALCGATRNADPRIDAAGLAKAVERDLTAALEAD